MTTFGSNRNPVDCKWCVVSARMCPVFELTELQLFDICSGLSFLHSLEIVHGDLKGVRIGFFHCCASVGSDLTRSSPFQDNILIDKSGRARLNDFGFTSIASQTCTETSAAGFKGSHRWMAPELFNIDNERKTGLSTNKTDIFALGMVTIEVRNIRCGRIVHRFGPHVLSPGIYRTNPVPGK